MGGGPAAAARMAESRRWRRVRRPNCLDDRKRAGILSASTVSAAEFSQRTTIGPSNAMATRVWD